MRTAGWAAAAAAAGWLAGGAVAAEPPPAKSDKAAAKPAAKAEASAAGLWMGTLQAGPQKLRLVVEVKPAGKDAKGAERFTATLDSLDQGAKGLPLDKVEATAEKLAFALTSAGATYAGKRDAKGRYAGWFTQGLIPLPLTFERIASRPTTSRPQDPKPPLPYRSEEVVVDNPAGPRPVKLAGTLTLPPGKGPFPAVALITGSGAQDRNEELMNHRPFLVLADHLTRKGIAVLRCDDRGVGGSGPASPLDTSATYATDAWAAAKYLRGRPEIAADRVGLVGHSEGGLIAPVVAAEHPKEIAFVVLLAGTGIDGREILRLQAALIMKANGASQATVDGNRKVQDAMFAVVAKEPDPAKAAAALEKALTELLPTLPADLKMVLGSKAARDAQVRMLNGAWMRHFLTFEPASALRRVTCPVLAINGAKDLQVPPKENLAAIRAALEAGGNRRVEAVELPGLNHLFQTCKTGAPAEYAAIDETFAPAALEAVSGWILRQAAR